MCALWCWWCAVSGRRHVCCSVMLSVVHYCHVEACVRCCHRAACACAHCCARLFWLYCLACAEVLLLRGIQQPRNDFAAHPDTVLRPAPQLWLCIHVRVYRGDEKERGGLACVWCHSHALLSPCAYPCVSLCVMHPCPACSDMFNNCVHFHACVKLL